jgi:hypothetical protein
MDLTHLRFAKQSVLAGCCTVCTVQYILMSSSICITGALALRQSKVYGWNHQTDHGRLKQLFLKIKWKDGKLFCKFQQNVNKKTDAKQAEQRGGREHLHVIFI